jgi:hypothetical protein
MHSGSTENPGVAGSIPALPIGMSVHFNTGSDTAAPKIAIDSVRVAAFCRQHHIQRLRLFGSVLRNSRMAVFSSPFPRP